MNLMVKSLVSVILRGLKVIGEAKVLWILVQQLQLLFRTKKPKIKTQKPTKETKNQNQKFYRGQVWLTFP